MKKRNNYASPSGKPAQQRSNSSNRNANRNNSNNKNNRNHGLEHATSRPTKHTATKPSHKAPIHAPAKPQAKSYTVEQSSELLSFLVAHVNMGRNAVKSVLARGQVSVNNKATTIYNFQLEAGDIVTVSKEKTSDAPAFVGLRIIHEDDDVIVINKDAGLLSVASPQEKELTAYRQLTAHVRQAHPGNRIFVIHRLDRDTSGVMMFAKSERVQQAMQQAWKENVQERLYVALVEGNVTKPEGTISSWLKESKTLKMYSSPYPNDGQHAVTHYKVLQSNRQYSLLEVQLETGRKNQIRAHMEDIGHPIVGDKKYGSKIRTIGRLGLHARVLSFTHPTTGKVLRFEADVPKKFTNLFAPANHA